MNFGAVTAEDYIESQLFRRVSPVAALTVGSIFTGYLLLYPNLILHYNQFLKYAIKYPVMVLIFVISFIFGVLAVRQYLFLLVILFLFHLNFMVVQNVFINQYLAQAILLLLMAGMFYRRPEYIGLFCRIGIFLAVIFGIQTIIVFLSWFADLLHLGRLPYEKIIFEGEFQRRDFIPLLGSTSYNQVAAFAGFRATSWFTEANRYAYFLTPLLYAAAYLRRGSAYYSFAFYFIALNILLTGSVMAMIAIFFTYFLYRYDTLGKKVKFVFMLLFLLIPLITLTYMAAPDFWAWIFNKTDSIKTRLIGLAFGANLVASHPYGCSMVTDCSDFKISVAAIHWLVFSGFQGLALIVIMGLYYLKAIFKLINHGGRFEKAFAYGSLALFMEQSFFGNYFEFYFVGMMAVMLALYALRRKTVRMMARIQAPQGRMAPPQGIR